MDRLNEYMEKLTTGRLGPFCPEDGGPCTYCAVSLNVSQTPDGNCWLEYIFRYSICVWHRPTAHDTVELIKSLTPADMEGILGEVFSISPEDFATSN